MSLQYDSLEQFAMMPGAKIVLSRDGQNFVMRSLFEASMEAADLLKAGYGVVGVVATCEDGIVRGIAECGRGPIIANAMAVFLYDKREARKPVPPLAWLEKLAALPDERTQV